MPCNRCGYCCRHISVTYEASEPLNEFLLARGYHRVQTSTDGKLVQYILAHTCPKLKGNNTCRIYEKRPAACRAYPHTLLYAQQGMDPQRAVGRLCRYTWTGKGWV